MASYEMLGEMSLSSVLSKVDISTSRSFRDIKAVENLYAALGERGFENMVAAINGTQTGTPMDPATAMERLKVKLRYPEDAAVMYRFLKSLSSTGYVRDALVATSVAPVRSGKMTTEEAIAAGKADMARKIAEAQAADAARLAALRAAQAPAQAPAPVPSAAQAPAPVPRADLVQANAPAVWVAPKKEEVPPTVIPLPAQIQIPSPLVKTANSAVVVDDMGPRGTSAIISPDTIPVPLPKVNTLEVPPPSPMPAPPPSEESKIPWGAIAIGAGVLFIAMR